MLAERKRFNYNVNTGQSSSGHKNTVGSAVKHTSTSAFQDQNPVCRSRQDKENIKKIQELQAVNRKLVDETARQFKKLEEDVQRVEGILQEKDSTLEIAKSQSKKLKEEVHKVSEEKKILIEAIYEKDLVIKEYEMRVKQLIKEKKVDAKTPEKPLSIMNQAVSVQTQSLPETCPKTEYANIQKQKIELEDEVYRLKEELFDATNKVKLLTQEFEAYKILKDIQNVQEN